MLRPAAAAVSTLLSSHHTTVPSLLSRPYSKGPNPVQKADRDESATKRWLAAQADRQETLPRNMISVKHSPSSKQLG